ncbi:MAG: hypothetical protein JNN33_04995 [Rhodospirillaceae bacterium]|nr:hypothetical protein [Rhodospirillaceae bacterium]
MYKITPEDRQYVEEFRAQPVGPHSPGLQRILNAMRSAPQAGKYVLVATKPHREWTLGILSGKRGEPVQLTSHVFTDLNEAELYVFRARWKAMTGEEIN